MTSYGLRLDGYPGNNTQQISNDIAHNVIGQVLMGGGLPSISNLLGDDVGTAIYSDNLTVGGWGGSFYYWNEMPTGQSMSVGALITADVQPGESWDGGDEDGLDGQYDKFVASNAGAIADSLPVYTAASLESAVLSTFGHGAEVPNYIGLQLFGRAIDIQEHGTAIVGDPNVIFDLYYDTYQKTWYDWSSLNDQAETLGVALLPTAITESTEIASLSAEQSYRAANQSLVGGSNSNGIGPKATDNSNDNFGTIVQGDGSYSTISVVSGQSTDETQAFADVKVYSSSGSLGMSVYTEPDGTTPSVSIYNSQGNGRRR